MLKKILFICSMLFLTLLLGLPLVCEASFEILAFNARSAGLADSFTAVADDANALIFNPGGLGQITRAQVSTQYTRLHVGLTDGSNLADGAVSYIQPFVKLGVFGIGYFSRSLSSLYKEELIILGYGKELVPDLYIGANLKYASLSTTISSDALTRSKVSQPSFDFGLLYNHQDWFLVGASISDLNQPNLNMTSQNNKIPSTIRAGFSYILNKEGTFILASDYTKKDKENKVSVGLENWVLPKFMGLRAGAVTGISDRELLNVTLGFTLKLKDLLLFDYAFIYPLKGIKDTIGSHRISLSARFGKELPKRERRIRKDEDKEYFEEFKEEWFEEKPVHKKPKKKKKKPKEKKDEFEEFREKWFQEEEE